MDVNVCRKESYIPKQTVSCWAVTCQIIPYIMANILLLKIKLK